MTHVTPLEYIYVFALASLVTLVLTPLALRFAVRRSLLDHPNAIKAQSNPVPYFGGAAIVAGFSVVVGAAAVLRDPESGPGQLLAVLGLAVALAAVGLVDDIRGLSPWVRLAAEAAAGVGVWWGDVARIEVLQNDALNLVVTVVWIVGVTNAFNLLDNMDGLSAGVAGIAAVFLFVLAQQNGQFLVATLSLALAGCAVGFLRSNFHPARIYMGDAGALFLGFVLAVLAMKLDYPQHARETSLPVPIILLGVPLLDMALVTANRLLHHRSPLSGGRDHISHRLVFVGIPVPVAVALIYSAAISLGCIALVISRIDRASALILIGWTGSFTVLAAVLLSRIPVYATSRRRHLMLQEVVKHEHEPPVPPTHQLEDDDEPSSAAQ